ncbi:DUF1330 domain-containing protein [Photobacterium sp. 1_MG-2023]|uniref:DUF1330 domain-containing protein n=1 Tax=Photobacterium sp. 1_MG-2023 TaxID=3062646 RepID=UPI0026E2C882|nr:DUF1330 domain-containing protein [Photobacterium sp. 1_MG-2023]MDO6707271.1 DUF1330 domain-containing protein [Photobacterium sp. 1_MG-2023]
MYELLLGMDISDEDGYKQYRQEMLPILTSYGGSFGYDFQVSEVLIAQTPEPINRVFTIRFPDEDQKTAFFNDPAYQKVKAKFFSPSVRHVTLIASYSL